MKKIKLVVVGKLKEKFYADACSEYLKRLNRYAEVTVCELRDRTVNEVKEESDDILSELKGYTVLTDIGGDALSSEQFSQMLDKAFLNYDTVTMVIGGSCGVDDRVRNAAKKKVSFGRMTYPHMLMRVILLEQIYRAFTISEGTPYHK